MSSAFRLLTFLSLSLLSSSVKIEENVENVESDVTRGKKYTIFGAGPSGLFAAWRLADSGRLTRMDTLELIEWGNYSFDGEKGSRRPAGRICSVHYKGNVKNSHVELGGMRYLKWNNKTKYGHKVVTKTITKLGLEENSTRFKVLADPLYHLRGKHLYKSEINESNPAPYSCKENTLAPSDIYVEVSRRLEMDNDLSTRAKKFQYTSNGKLSKSIKSNVYKAGDRISNIGYWNFFLDQMGSEAFNYAANGGGYTTIAVNTNAAASALFNVEFEPGLEFKTLKNGFSQLFEELFKAIKKASKEQGFKFIFKPNTRLHAIWTQDSVPQYQLAKGTDPYVPATFEQTDYAFLAMPTQSIELVARATRYSNLNHGLLDFLNIPTVAKYLESVTIQAMYKVLMFFDRPWWLSAKYPPRANASIGEYGPTVTDLPLRMIYYFGDNAAPDSPDGPAYGMLVSYDDARFTRFWHEMEEGIDEQDIEADSQDFMPLYGAKKPSKTMEKTILQLLASVHFDGTSDYTKIPAPLETKYIDWEHNPFKGGYHMWEAHADPKKIMDKIRTPAEFAREIVEGEKYDAENAKNANVFIIGEAYSYDQGWVEGAFCSAESVLNDFLGITPFVDTADYPLV